MATRRRFWQQDGMAAYQMPMNGWVWGTLALSVVGLPAAIYGIHRLALRLERLGYIDYSKSPPKRIGNVLAPFQSVIEPPARHVFEIQDHRRGDETRRDGAAPNP